MAAGCPFQHWTAPGQFPSIASFILRTSEPPVREGS
jgi:hypothetical protein